MEKSWGVSSPNTEEYTSSYIKLFGRYVGERVQIRTGWQETPAVGTVVDLSEIGIVIDTGTTARLYPWSAISSVRGRA